MFPISFGCFCPPVIFLVRIDPRHPMKMKTLIVGCVVLVSLAPAAYAQTASTERAVINQFCSNCHSDKAKGAGMDSARKIDFDSLDIEHVGRDAETWEHVVRKLRAGMMPPSGMRRPDQATYKGLITWLESELDRNATTYTPPPGLHRLNRTEYANVIKDLLDLDIDPAKYLPSDD